MRRIIAVALFAVACGSITVQAHTISLAFKAGDTYKYAFHSTSKQTISTSGVSVPADIDTKADEVVTVKSVDSSGTASLTVTLSNFKLTSTTGGVTNTTTGLPMDAIDMQVASDGRLISLGSNQIAASNPFASFIGLSGGFFITAVLPSNAVQPGNTWTKTYDQANPNGSGGMHFTSTSTYLRDESFKGVNAAVIETKSNGTIDMTLDTSKTASGQSSSAGFQGLSIKGTVTSDVTTWIDPNGHRVMKTHAAVTNDGTMDLQAAPSQAIPGLTGPIAIKGNATTDLTPA